MAIHDVGGAANPVDELAELQRRHEELERQNKHIRRQLLELLQRDCQRLADENGRMMEQVHRVEARWVQPASTEDMELERLRWEKQQLEMKCAELASA